MYLYAVYNKKIAIETWYFAIEFQQDHLWGARIYIQAARCPLSRESSLNKCFASNNIEGFLFSGYAVLEVIVSKMNQ